METSDSVKTRVFSVEMVRREHPRERLDELLQVERISSGTTSRYLATQEAAAYLGRSVSWLLRQAGIPYLRGKPNTYSIQDLDDWFEANKYIPLP